MHSLTLSNAIRLFLGLLITLGGEAATSTVQAQIIVPVFEQGGSAQLGSGYDTTLNRLMSTACIKNVDALMDPHPHAQTSYEVKGAMVIDGNSEDILDQTNIAAAIHTLATNASAFYRQERSTHYSQDTRDYDFYASIYTAQDRLVDSQGNQTPYSLVPDDNNCGDVFVDRILYGYTLKFHYHVTSANSSELYILDQALKANGATFDVSADVLQKKEITSRQETSQLDLKGTGIGKDKSPPGFDLDHMTLASFVQYVFALKEKLEAGDKSSVAAIEVRPYQVQQLPPNEEVAYELFAKHRQLEALEGEIRDIRANKSKYIWKTPDNSFDYLNPYAPVDPLGGPNGMLAKVDAEKTSLEPAMTACEQKHFIDCVLPQGFSKGDYKYRADLPIKAELSPLYQDLKDKVDKVRQSYIGWQNACYSNGQAQGSNKDNFARLHICDDWIGYLGNSSRMEMISQHWDVEPWRGKPLFDNTGDDWVIENNLQFHGGTVHWPMPIQGWPFDVDASTAAESLNDLRCDHHLDGCVSQGELYSELQR